MRDERLPKGPQLHPSPRKSGAVLGTPQFASESLDADTGSGTDLKLYHYPERYFLATDPLRITVLEGVSGFMLSSAVMKISKSL